MKLTGHGHGHDGHIGGAIVADVDVVVIGWVFDCQDLAHQRDTSRFFRA